MVALVLASASPRRVELLASLGVAFSQRPADIDETVRAGEAPEDYVARLAREKSAAVQRVLDADSAVEDVADSAVEDVADSVVEDVVGSAVLAADTCVVLDGEVLGKPADRAAAESMLGRLSGREHRVLTALCLRRGSHTEEALSDTRVKFLPLSQAQRDAYLATDEPWDKAGAYAIQGRGGAFVEWVRGSRSGVVGLPLALTRQLLRRAGVLAGNVLEGDVLGEDVG